VVQKSSHLSAEGGNIKMLYMEYFIVGPGGGCYFLMMMTMMMLPNRFGP